MKDPLPVSEGVEGETVLSHTPGPWTVDSDFRTSMGKLFVRPGTTGYLLAEVPAFGLLYESHEGQADANARLIAAAPQMFAALAELLAERNGGALHGPLPDTFGAALAREAIAKAEGR